MEEIEPCVMIAAKNDENVITEATIEFNVVLFNHGGVKNEVSLRKIIKRDADYDFPKKTMPN